MNKALLKEIIKLKLRAIDRAAGLLPTEAQDRMKKCRDEILEAITDAALEYRKVSTVSNEDKALKNIAID